MDSVQLSFGSPGYRSGSTCLGGTEICFENDIVMLMWWCVMRSHRARKIAFAFSFPRTAFFEIKTQQNMFICSISCMKSGKQLKEKVYIICDPRVLRPVLAGVRKSCGLWRLRAIRLSGIRLWVRVRTPNTTYVKSWFFIKSWALR